MFDYPRAFGAALLIRALVHLSLTPTAYATTLLPTIIPTPSPSLTPTWSVQPTSSLNPTLAPTLEPSLAPAPSPSPFPTAAPTTPPTPRPTKQPTALPLLGSSPPLPTGPPLVENEAGTDDEKSLLNVGSVSAFTLLVILCSLCTTLAVFACYYTAVDLHDEKKEKKRAELQEQQEEQEREEARARGERKRERRAEERRQRRAREGEEERRYRRAHGVIMERGNQHAANMTRQQLEEVQTETQLQQLEEVHMLKRELSAENLAGNFEVLWDNPRRSMSATLRRSNSTSSLRLLQRELDASSSGRAEDPTFLWDNMRQHQLSRTRDYSAGSTYSADDDVPSRRASSPNSPPSPPPPQNHTLRSSLGAPSPIVRRSSFPRLPTAGYAGDDFLDDSPRQRSVSSADSSIQNSPQRSLSRDSRRYDHSVPFSAGTSLDGDGFDAEVGLPENGHRMSSTPDRERTRTRTITL